MFLVKGVSGCSREGGEWTLGVKCRDGTRRPNAEPYLMVVSDEQQRRELKCTYDVSDGFKSV